MSTSLNHEVQTDSPLPQASLQDTPKSLQKHAVKCMLLKEGAFAKIGMQGYLWS